VTRVRFSNDEDYLLSTGGNDRTILLWDVVGEGKEKMSKKVLEEQEDEEDQEEAAEKGDEEEQN
jgi:WD40 repeat protein